MKRFNLKILFAVVLLTVSAVVLYGCMDRSGDADVGGAGARASGTDAPGTTSAGEETTSHSAADVDETDGAETEPLPAGSGSGSVGEPDTPGDVPVIPDDIRSLITEKYTKFHSIDGVNIKGYFGEFNGAYAVMIYETGKEYTQGKWEETVDGVKFSYNDGNRILVYDGETFLTLEEAFDKGVLTHDDLVAIASRRQLLSAQDDKAER